MAYVFTPFAAVYPCPNLTLLVAIGVIVSIIGV